MNADQKENAKLEALKLIAVFMLSCSIGFCLGFGLKATLALILGVLRL